LVLAIHNLAQALYQQAGLVARKQAVPIGSPYHLNDVPACAAEGRLQLLDDFASATHRAVQTLEVAIDHEDQVVELLARGQGERAHGLWLIGLSVAYKRPHLARGLGDD